jgi:tetratricopeptide (TPR) repeat protein
MQHRASSDSLKGWKKVESRYKTFQSGISGKRPFRSSGAVLGMIAIFFSLTLLSGCHRDPNVRKQKYFESGQRYSSQGKEKEAVIQFSNALKIDKNFADAYYARSQSYLHLGVMSSAYSDLQHTVYLQPANYKARLDLGNMMLAGGRTDDALAQANATLLAQPNNADAHALLCRVAARRGKMDIALAEIHTALSLAPNEAALHETLAMLEANDPAQAANVEAEMKKSVELDPKSVNAKLLLASYYARNGRLQDAEQMSWKAVATDPKNLGAREALVQLILRQGDQARAEQVLRQTSNDLADNPRGVQMLADYYVGSGQTDKAKAEFAGLAKKYPKNVAVQEGYVKVLLQVKDFGTAQSVVAELMKKNGKDPQVVVLNGIVLLNSGKLIDAVNALQTAVNDAPKDAFIQYWLGRAALAKGDNSLAEKSFQQAAQLNPRNVEAEEELARMAAQRGDTGILADVAEKTIAADPHYPGGYLWRATAELSRNEADKAEADLKTAMTVAPQSAQAYLMLGEIRFSQKKFPEGVALLEQALQHDPNSVRALRGLVKYDLFSKKPDQAFARVNAQIAKSPRNSGFLDVLAELQLQAKNVDQAIATIQKAMEVNSDDSDAVSMYASLQSQRGQTANAVKAWEKWSIAHPGNAGALAILGTMTEVSGDKQKAEEYYKKALQIQPKQPIAANNLAYMMLQNGENVDVALSLAQTARQGMQNTSSADTLAWAYYTKGTYGFARDLLEDAVKTEPNNITMQYHLGMVYSKMRDKSNATIHLKKVISIDSDSQFAKDAETALQGLD